MDCKHGLQSNIVGLFTSECGSNRAAAVLAKKAGEEAEIEGLEQEVEGLREECDRADRAAAEAEEQQEDATGRVEAAAALPAQAVWRAPISPRGGGGGRPVLSEEEAAAAAERRLARNQKRRQKEQTKSRYRNTLRAAQAAAEVRGAEAFLLRKRKRLPSATARFFFSAVRCAD